MVLRNSFTSRLYSSGNPKALICQLCEGFYDQGWVTGSGGGMCIKVDDRVYVAPTGVQKENLIEQDVFTLSAEDKDVILEPPTTPDLRQSACTPLWFEVFKYRPAARAVIHTHSMNAQLVTLINGDDAKELKITHFEMLKGVKGYGYEDELIIPIIDNRPTEDLLAEQLATALQNYPDTSAVLVRRHGLYVWGDSWEKAKIHAECYDYLFETALRVNQMEIDFTIKPRFSTYRNGDDNNNSQNEPEKKRMRKIVHGQAYSHVLLDIEGTTTPISFVKATLFPLSSSEMVKFLSDHWNKENEYVSDQIVSLFEQWKEDKKKDDFPGMPDYICPSTCGPEPLAAYLRWNIQQDRKLSPLKVLQGMIWQGAYEKGSLRSTVYPDVKRALERLQANNIPVSIFSSGSKQAQQLLFKYSDQGDLRNMLASYFDTKMGSKKEDKSYREITSCLGLIDDPSKLLFITDVLEEAVAARLAGLSVKIAVRPGNAPLAATEDFDLVHNFDFLG